MKKALRYSLLGTLLVMVLAGVGYLLYSCDRARDGLTCKEVEVSLLDGFQFVNPGEIREALEKECIGAALDSLDLSEIEKNLEDRNVILGSEAWTTDDGTLHVTISQRAPVVRCNRGDKGFYIDETGYVFPVHKSYTAEVRTIDGEIPRIENGENAQWISGVIGLVRFIDCSKEWNTRVDKIYVDDNGDINVMLEGHDERFIIGEPCEIGSKFKRIDKYFSYIAPSVSVGYYKTVNLKFNKQLICRRDI